MQHAECLTAGSHWRTLRTRNGNRARPVGAGGMSTLMAKRETHDIYSAEQKPSSGSRLETVGPIQDNPWVESMREMRRTTLVFRMVLLLFVFVLALVVIRQFFLLTNLRSAPPVTESTTDVALRSASLFDFEGDVREYLIMDELDQLSTTPIPEDGHVPFDVHWLKQAAYHILKAETAYRNEEISQAIESYNTVLQMFPEIQGVRAQLGLCYMRVEDYARASQAFEQAAEETPDAHRVLNNLGVSLLVKGDYESAEGLLKQAVEAQAAYAPARYNLALLYFRTGMYEDARVHFEAYLQQQAGNVEALQLYTHVLIQLAEWDRAARLLMESASAMPKAAPVHFKLAQVLAQLDRNDEAMTSLERGVNLLDAPKALALLAQKDYDRLRGRSDFKTLVNHLEEASRNRY